MRTLWSSLLLVALLTACAGESEPGLAPDPAPVPSSSPPTSPPGSPSSSPSAASVTSSQREVARAFVDFARGSGDAVPWSDEVRYDLYDGKVATLTPDQAGDRERWRACPPGESTVEGRDCPVSPLETIASASRSDRALPLQAKPPRVVGCNRLELPRITSVVDTVTIRQRAGARSCFDDFAVTLMLDAQARIVAVDFVLSGP